MSSKSLLKKIAQGNLDTLTANSVALILEKRFPTPKREPVTQGLRKITVLRSK